MKTSKFFFATALLLATATTQAQEPTNTTSIPNFNHSISFEIGAPNNLPGEKKNKVDAFAYLNIGYRHVANNDFVFCAGVTPHSSFSPTRATTEAKWALCPTSTWAKHSKCNTAYDFSLANTVHRLRFSFHVFETVRETMHASSLHCLYTVI